MTSRLPDDYFDRMYAESADPWQLSNRWYEQRKYAITMALLPSARFRHAFEPGCSIGTVTELLAARCDRVTAVDVADAALRHCDRRLRKRGCRHRVTLARASLDDPWPAGPFDLVLLSEVAYYLDAATLERVLRRECAALAPGATVVAVHWRHVVADYPLSGDAASEIIAATPGLVPIGRYCDRDVTVAVFDTGDGASVAAREGLF